MVGRGDQVQPSMSAPSDEMTITIKPHGSESYPLQVRRDETVKQVKQTIYELHPKSIIDPGFIRFIFEGKQLDEDRTMEECNIQDHSTVHMSLRFTRQPPRHETTWPMKEQELLETIRRLRLQVDALQSDYDRLRLQCDPDDLYA